MANPKRAQVILELDRSRTLVIDFNALCEAEGVLGHTIARQEVGLSELRAIMWAGLRHEDSTLTVKQVGDFIGTYGMNVLSEKVGKCLADFFNQGEAQGVAEGS